MHRECGVLWEIDLGDCQVRITSGYNSELAVPRSRELSLPSSLFFGNRTNTQYSPGDAIMAAI